MAGDLEQPVVHPSRPAFEARRDLHHGVRRRFGSAGLSTRFRSARSSTAIRLIISAPNATTARDPDTGAPTAAAKPASSPITSRELVCRSHRYGPFTASGAPGTTM